MNSRCKLCEKQKKLRKSHAIPSAFFKEIIKQQGDLISYNFDSIGSPEKVGNEAKGYLLCGCCEGFLNNTYEKYVVTLLKSGSLQNKKTTLNFKEEGSVFKFSDNDLNGNHVVNFIISVFWRASLLKIDFYDNVSFPSETLKWMKKHIISNKKPCPSIIGIEIRTLIDTTNVITKTHLKEFIASPFILDRKVNCKYAMIFGGYLFTIVMSNYKRSKRTNQISECTKIYLSRNIEVLSIPAIVELL